MSSVVLPFSTDKEIMSGESLIDSDLYKNLPDSLKEVVEEYPHILEYLNIFPIEQMGMPEYHAELSRDMGDIKKPNLIYPTQKEGTFIHILANPLDFRSSYIPIEPTLTIDVADLMIEVEEKLLELRTHLDPLDEEIGRTEQILAYLEKVTTLGNTFSIGLLLK